MPRVLCPKCRSTLKIAQALTGPKKVRCPKCEALFTIGKKSSPQVVAAPSSPPSAPPARPKPGQPAIAKRIGKPGEPKPPAKTPAALKTPIQPVVVKKPAPPAPLDPPRKPARSSDDNDEEPLVSRKLVITLCILVVMAGLGFGGSFMAYLFGGPDGIDVRGNITLNGQPLGQGIMSFIPAPGTAGLSGEAEIRDGQYLAKHIKVGNYAVEIRSFQKTGKRVTGPYGMTDEQLNVIPDRYHKNTILQFVPANDPNQLDFHLTKDADIVP
jgi:hypothetical protein